MTWRDNTNSPRFVAVIDGKVVAVDHRYDMGSKKPERLSGLPNEDASLIYCGFDLDKYTKITPLPETEKVDVDYVIPVTMQPRKIIISAKPDNEKDLEEIKQQRITISNIVEKLIADARNIAGQAEYRYYGLVVESSPERGPLVVPGVEPHNENMAERFLAQQWPIGRRFQRYEQMNRYAPREKQTQTWVMTPTALLYVMKPGE
ncbi:hypothetical protein H6503_03850 [Candidatus Woesearchaeota archaeon]|nr:hypothetical protein [Candidatus Woesearchaeota archaeon]